MFSIIYLLIPIILIITTIIVKFDWFKKLFTSKTTPENNIPQHDIKMDEIKQIENKDELFAINDDGNFDLMDMNGKVLNIGFGPNPKVYINLLDQSEKDTDRKEMNGRVSFISKVGDIKQYEIGGRPYIVNFTRLN